MILNSSSAGPAAQNSILPPELPWNGKSKSLLREFASSAQYSPSIARWFENSLEPILARDLDLMGHMTARYINFIDDLDPTKGLEGGALLPRFSTGYSDIRQSPWPSDVYIR
jgi:hypothetical protein